MLFNSFEFMLFLPVVFLLYWFVTRGRRWQNLLVVVASYVFYGWWDWRFLLLIVFTSACSFASGLLIEHYEGRRSRQRTVSAANIVVNLSVLGVFKYYNFFAENLASLLALAGWHVDWATVNIILPVGISFYTFQALSYSIDVYQRKLSATRDAVEFFAYISFFPQLVAGPIERVTNLLPQFQRERRFDYARAVDGMRQMLWGLLKKLVVADNCAMVVNEYWDSCSSLPGAGIFIVGVLFTMQIYCDFSGYSDIAIGCARLFGFSLMRNFHFPYFSRSVPEFWRRWHISLMTWFRDYIYIPLGGSRCGRWKTVRNVFVVWAVSGLWHGANWTFVVWGLYHAVILVVYNLLGIRGATGANGTGGASGANGTLLALLPSVKELLQMAFTFFLVVVGWIIFRAETIGQAVDYICSMFTNSPFGPGWLIGKKCLLYSSLLLLAEWLQRDREHALMFPQGREAYGHARASWLLRFAAVRYAIYIAIVYVLMVYAGEVQTFIYFQF